MGCRRVLVGLLMLVVLVIGVAFFFYSSASYVYPDLDTEYDQEEFEALTARMMPEQTADSLDLTLTEDELRTFVLGNMQRDEKLVRYVSGLDIGYGADTITLRTNANIAIIRERLQQGLPLNLLGMIIRKDAISFQVTIAPELEGEEILVKVREFKIGKLGLPVGRLLALLEKPLSTVEQVNIAEGGRIVVEISGATVEELSLDETRLKLMLTGVEPVTGGKKGSSQ